MSHSKKKKIINDPVYGFISIPYTIILDIIDHPYFQRLRRIKQLGLSDLVYPGALHTRFNHAIGCMHLMQQAIQTLRGNGHEITDDEAKGILLAILLHDIGHGPFSHALEYSFVTDKNITHETISGLFMNALNKEFNGELNIAIDIFNNTYPKQFLHQLVSGQLDMDRLDYLKRDSFYTGVSEGVVSNQRIIKMLDIKNDQLVVQEKGIYSIEKFIVARRLMYWQVYLHKTVISAEFMLIKLIDRARFLANRGEDLLCSASLKLFLFNAITANDFKDRTTLDAFAQLDDSDIMNAIKEWSNHTDPILSDLSQRIRDRKLLKIKIQTTPFDASMVKEEGKKVMQKLGFPKEDYGYFVFSDWIENNAYNPESDRISILYKDGSVKDITAASDNLNIQALARPVRKYFLCYPNNP